MRSQQLAAAAWSGGHFAKSVVPVKDINGLTVLAEDEHMRPEVTADGLGKLGSAFAGLAELGGFCLLYTSVATSPVCNQPSGSIASAVCAGELR